MNLTDNEKRDATKVIEGGKPLPDKHRSLLFNDDREVELIWMMWVRTFPWISRLAVIPLPRNRMCWRRWLTAIRGAGNVEGLQAGIYKYRLQGHELEKVAGGDVRVELCAAALDQECVEDGAAVLVFAAV